MMHSPPWFIAEALPARRGRIVRRQAQGGMLLPVALFLLVVMAAMGAYAMRLVVLANATSSQDIQGARAYQAALAGQQWMAYQLYQPDTSPPAMQSCPATTTLTINGYSVTVSCSSLSEVDRGNQNVNIYEVTSRASRGSANTPEYTERQVTVTLSRCLQTVAAGTTYECG